MSEHKSDLDHRIKQARDKLLGDTLEDVKDFEKKLSHDDEKSARAGSEFISTIIAGAILGFTIDYFCKTVPLATIFFIVLAFVSAVYRANATMNKNDEKK